MAKERAQVSGISLGDWISLQLRKSLLYEKEETEHYVVEPDDGLDIPVIKGGNELVTNRFIDDLRDELGI